MKIKISEATGSVLDWLVAKAEGWTWRPRVKCNDTKENLFERTDQTGVFRKLFHELHYSTDWSQGGPIIERERIGVYQSDRGGWHGQYPGWLSDPLRRHPYIAGPTPLIAAMRCFIASKLGDEVEVPDELT